MLDHITSMIMRCRPAPAQNAREPRQRTQDEQLGYTARASFIELAERMARCERLPLHLAMARLKVERPAEYRAAFPARRSRRRSMAPVQARPSPSLLFEHAI